MNIEVKKNPIHFTYLFIFHKRIKKFYRNTYETQFSVLFYWGGTYIRSHIHTEFLNGQLQAVNSHVKMSGHKTFVPLRYTFFGGVRILRRSNIKIILRLVEKMRHIGFILHFVIE